MSELKTQRGFVLLESLLAILIFSLGILGMVATYARAVQAAGDAEYRTEAARLADEIASRITLAVNRGADRTNPVAVSAAIAASLPAFAHQATGSATAAACAFTGAVSGNTIVTDWVGKVGAALPASSAARQQIVVDATAAGFNRVAITLCWRAPSDQAFRQHSLVTYIN